MMKYLLFIVFATVSVPLMLTAGRVHRRFRELLFTLLVFSTALGDIANINFYSMEWYRGPDKGFEVNLTDLIAAALLGIFVSKYAGRMKWLPFNSLPMFAIFGLAVFSASTAEAPLYAFFTLFKLVKFYLIYWCAANCLRAGIRPAVYWRAFVAIGIYVTVLCLQQKYLGGIYRVSGPFDHSNVLPPYLNMIIPVLLIWGLTEPRIAVWKTILSVLTVFGMLFCVFATFSRGGAAFGLIGLIAAVFFMNTRRSSKRAILATGAIFLLLSAGVFRVSSSFIDRIQNAPEESIETRRELNISSSMMAAEHPIGVGLNNFSDELTRVRRYQQSAEMRGDSTAPVAHSIYYLTMAELGCAGLVLYLLIIGRFVLHFTYNAIRMKTLLGLLLGGLAIGFGALHASGFLEFAFPITPVFYLFAILSGFAVALVERGLQERKSRIAEFRRAARGQL